MIDDPKVSVLLPIYGHEPHLEPALSSLSNQSYNSFETIVVVEDPSKRTEEILRRSSVSIDRIEYEGEGGISGALNKGINQCSGEYIARMDADDISLRDRLEVQVEYLDKHPNVGVLGGAYNTINKKGLFVTEVYPPNSHSAVLWRLLLNNCIPHPTVMIRSSVLESIQSYYRERYNYVEDYELWTRIADEVQINNIDRKVLNYRRNCKTPHYRGIQEKRALEVSKRTINNVLPKIDLSGDEIRDVKAIVYKHRHAKDKQKAVENLFDLFVEYIGQVDGDEEQEVRKEFVTETSRGVLHQLDAPSDLSVLIKLLSIDPQLPVYLLRKGRGRIIQHIYRWDRVL